MEFTIPTTIPLQAYLALAAVLFCTGVWGLINSRNAVRLTYCRPDLHRLLLRDQQPAR